MGQNVQKLHHKNENFDLKPDYVWPTGIREDLGVLNFKLFKIQLLPESGFRNDKNQDK